MRDELVKSHIEWLRGDHELCNPFLAERIEALQVRLREAEAERDALREALVKADELAGAIENDVWQNTQTWFALTAYREARDALKREADT